MRKQHIKIQKRYIKRRSESILELTSIVLSIILFIFSLAVNDLWTKNNELAQENTQLQTEIEQIRQGAAEEAHEAERLRELLIQQEEEQPEHEEIPKELPKMVKANEFISTYRDGKSPFKDYVDQFFKEDEMRGKIAFAIAGKETGFATAVNQHYNAWGYFCNRGGVRPDCGWASIPIENLKDFIKENGLQDASEDEIRWRYAITRYIESASPRYLSLFDGTCESIRNISNAGYYKSGYDGANQQAVDKWVSDVCWFTQQI